MLSSGLKRRPSPSSVPRPGLARRSGSCRHCQSALKNCMPKLKLAVLVERQMQKLLHFPRIRSSMEAKRSRRERSSRGAAAQQANLCFWQRRRSNHLRRGTNALPDSQERQAAPLRSIR